MLKNNAKTILFTSLIVAMILPFSGMNFAQADKEEIEKYEPTKISDAIKQITPYVTLDDSYVLAWHIAY